MSLFKKSPRDQPVGASGVLDPDDRAPRVLIALVLDTSSSMEGAKVNLLNRGLAELVQDLQHDLELSTKAQVALITFGAGGVIAWRGQQPTGAGQSPFVPVRALQLPVLRAEGVTPMVEAVELAIRCVAQEKQTLKQRGRQYYRPLIWLISDGLPTDAQGKLSQDWKPLVGRLRAEEEQARFLFFTVSAGDMDPAGDAILDQLSPNGHLRLDTLDFSAALSLVTASARSAQQGGTQETIKEEIAAMFRQRAAVS